MAKIFSGSFPKTHTWYQLPLPRGKASCSEGSAYHISVKRGATNKLVVFFAGGGMSWDETSAAHPISIWSLFNGQGLTYFSRIGIQEWAKAGLLGAKNPKNPFNDWNYILLPYATGDFHVGDNDFAYPGRWRQRKILRHYGARNVTASLEAAKELFPPPEQLLIAGESAGALGCVAQAAHVVEYFPDCKHIAVFSDSGQLSYTRWKETVRDVWQAQPDLCECITTDTLLLDWFRLLYHKLGERASYLSACSHHDGLLSQYQNKLNHGRFKLDPAGLQEFHAGLIETQQALLQEIPGYNCYISAWNENKKTGATAHTASRSRLFFNKNADGISLAAWLDDAVNQGRRYNIGLELLGIKTT